jgi:hypothetical protein
MLLAMTKCFAMTGLFDMQATLFGSLIFPPPATGAEILAQADGAGARGATDAGEKLVVQGVVVHVV